MKKLLSLFTALPLVAILMFSPLVFAGTGDLVVEGKNVEVSPKGISYGASYFPDYNEVDQGATGNGRATKDYIDTISTDSATLVFQHNSGAATTTYTFSTSEIIPSNINVIIEKGAIFSIAAAQILTINGPFDAGLYQVFSGAGGVVFGTGVNELNICWWGAVGDGATDSTSAIQKAIDCAETIFANNPVYASWSYTAPGVLIPSGVFIVTGLTVEKQIMIKGFGNETSFLKSNTNAAIIVANMAGTANHKYPNFRDFAIVGGVTLTLQHGITSTLHCRLENMVIEKVGGDGFKSTNGNNNAILYSVIQGNGGYGIHLTGTYNTFCQIIGNTIRENKIGIYIKPSSGTLTTGFILNNVIESNISVEGSRYTNTQVGTAERPGVGIWLENVQYLEIADNYFENQLNDIYSPAGASLNAFRNNYHGGSTCVPGDYTGHGGPVRKMQNITLTGGLSNQVVGCRFDRPVKPAGTSAADWGTTWNATTGTVTDISDGFGSLTHVASITLTAGDVAAMGIVAGSWIHFTGIVGTVGTDSANGLNDHSFQVVGIQGEILAISPTDLTGLTYTSGGTVQMSTTWPYEYDHIHIGSRGLIENCIWQSLSGVNEQLLLNYSFLNHVSNISTGISGTSSKYHNSGAFNMVWGNERTNKMLWHSNYYKYFNSVAMSAFHQFYGLSGMDHVFKYIETNVAGEPTGNEAEAFIIGSDGLGHTDEILTAAGAVSIAVPGTRLDSTAGIMAVTLANGHYVGQIKTIQMKADGGDVTLTVSQHGTSYPEVFTFDAVCDLLMLVWNGHRWETLKNLNVTT